MLAKHICSVHKNLVAPKLDIETVDIQVIKAYVS